MSDIETEARELIENALGHHDLIGEVTDRATGSSQVFLEAAKAFLRHDGRTAATVLADYVKTDRDAFDVCAAGAAAVATLFVPAP